MSVGVIDERVKPGKPEGFEGKFPTSGIVPINANVLKTHPILAGDDIKIQKSSGKQVVPLLYPPILGSAGLRLENHRAVFAYVDHHPSLQQVESSCSFDAGDMNAPDAFCDLNGMPRNRKIKFIGISYGTFTADQMASVIVHGVCTAVFDNLKAVSIGVGDRIFWQMPQNPVSGDRVTPEIRVVSAVSRPVISIFEAKEKQVHERMKFLARKHDDKSPTAGDMTDILFPIVGNEHQKALATCSVFQELKNGNQQALDFLHSGTTQVLEAMIEKDFETLLVKADSASNEVLLLRAAALKAALQLLVNLMVHARDPGKGILLSNSAGILVSKWVSIIQQSIRTNHEQNFIGIALSACTRAGDPVRLFVGNL
jgi:hypothetical protein